MAELQTVQEMGNCVIINFAEAQYICRPMKTPPYAMRAMRLRHTEEVLTRNAEGYKRDGMQLFDAENLG